jgi:hypothetical protein
MPSTPNDRLSFLPYELRLRVYSYLLCADDGSRITFWISDLSKAERKDTSYLSLARSRPIVQSSAYDSRLNKDVWPDVWPEHVWHALLRGTSIGSPTRILLTCELKGVEWASSLDLKYGNRGQQSSNLAISGIIYELTGAMRSRKNVSSATRNMKIQHEKLLARGNCLGLQTFLPPCYKIRYLAIITLSNITTSIAKSLSSL